MQQEELVNSFLRRMGHLHYLVTKSPLAEFLQGELRLLSYLVAHSGEGEEVLPGELSTAFSLSTARITAMLNSMEKKGLVSREISQKDRRKINVSLTQEGRQLFEERHRCGIALITSFLDELGERDVREINRILDRILELSNRHAMAHGLALPTKADSSCPH